MLPASLRGRVIMWKGDDMDELISKRAVIEAIEKARANVGHNLERSIGKSIIEILDDVGRDVDRLPSAHGTNLAEVGTDLISRQAAITALTFAKETGIMKCGELKGVIEVLNRLPSAGQRRGRWMSLPHKRARICSWCEHDEPYKFADDDTPIYNFCPHCGADMRGE